MQQAQHGPKPPPIAPPIAPLSRPYRAPIAPPLRPYRAPIAPILRPYCSLLRPPSRPYCAPIAPPLRPHRAPIAPHSPRWPPTSGNSIWRPLRARFARSPRAPGRFRICIGPLDSRAFSNKPRGTRTGRVRQAAAGRRKHLQRLDCQHRRAVSAGGEEAGPRRLRRRRRAVKKASARRTAARRPQSDSAPSC